MTHSISTAAWPDAQMSPKSRLSRTPVLVALALGAAVVTSLFVPAASFRARALVAVADVGSPLSAILPRNAGEAAVSKPIMARAAESLVGTGFPAPEPDVAERVAVATHIAGTKATGKIARLAADLPRHVEARPGEMPGTLDIVGSGETADRATQIASAVAESLIAGQDETIAAVRRKREADAAARLERLRSEAAAARRQLAALGGDEADPAQVLAAAAAQTAKAKQRVDTIRAIISSGAPPLSDRRDVPSAIETLQSAYLDLARQLAKARETLGERHTTIISLRAELHQASASLTAEWRRLARMADAELAAARDRETTLRQADTGGAPRRSTIEETRRKVQVADEAVARALSAVRETAADEHGYRLIMRPLVPNAAEGLTLVPRLLLSGLAGLLTLGVALLVARWWSARPFAVRAAALGVEDVAPPLGRSDTRHEALPEARGETASGQADPVRDRPASDTDTPPSTLGAENPGKDSDGDARLAQAMIDLLPQLEAIEPAFGPLPTVMVAANEITADVTPVALALGRAAAGRGLRVLLLEATRSRPELAAYADVDADPILVDYFGTLRVALRAAASEGVLFLAPLLRRGAHIASALARQGGTPLIDDIGAEFDLVVIDGGRSADAVAAGWGADAYLRVGRCQSSRDDGQFAAAFAVPQDKILGTVVASTVSRAADQPILPTARPAAPIGRPAPRAGAASNLTASNPVRRAPPRRKIAAR